MVGYTHDSKMLWRLWDPEFERAKAQSEVVFDEEWNAHMSCQHESNEIDIFELTEDEEYVEESDTGDEPLRDSQPIQIGSQSTQVGSQPTQIGVDPNHTCIKLLTRKQKTATAGASAERTRLPRVQQQMQKISPTTGATAERIRLPGARHQQSRNEAKYCGQFQFQLQPQLQLELRR